MDKFDRIAREIAAEALDWPPHGPCTAELWEEIRDILRREFGESDSEWLPLPAGFHNNNPLAETLDDLKKTRDKKSEKKFDERKSHTFQEWSDHGFRILKGSKSTGRNDENMATFKRNQVIIHDDPVVASWSPEDHDYELDPELYDDPFYGCMGSDPSD